MWEEIGGPYVGGNGRPRWEDYVGGSNWEDVGATLCGRKQNMGESRRTHRGLQLASYYFDLYFVSSSTGASHFDLHSLLVIEVRGTGVQMGFLLHKWEDVGGTVPVRTRNLNTYHKQNVGQTGRPLCGRNPTCPTCYLPLWPTYSACN